MASILPKRRAVESPPPPPPPHLLLPAGYVLGGLHAGVKKKPGVPDLAVILSTSEHPTSAAACFTRNAFKAAPVLVSDAILQRNGGYARAVVVNSGCANATDKLLPSTTAAKDFAHETLVMSTGVIGQTLPIAKIVEGIRAAPTVLGADFAAWERAAQAFMTTDTFPKLRARTFTIGGTEYRMAGMDKGAGMIHPSMGPASTAFAGTRQLHATLLGCILTDAAVSPRSLQSALTYAVDRSFNAISVDGDMSTNDSVYVLANGAASNGAAVIDEETSPDAYDVFKRELTTFAADLAKLVVRDGEGATKFVTVTVKGAPSYNDAHAIASRISTSALVKPLFTAKTQNPPTLTHPTNHSWGRILAATGSVNVSFVPSDGTPALAVLVRGEPEAVDEARAKEILSQEDFEVVARYWTCDFSYEYVRINGDYRS
ncbi:hypothetical protein BJ912DRAFT_1022946 [Pholiota molesta]|nr:hypothetical protein BJ912DRAFT_1022946 [Pholiota molesta]